MNLTVASTTIETEMSAARRNNATVPVPNACFAPVLDRGELSRFCELIDEVTLARGAGKNSRVLLRIDVCRGGREKAA